MATMSLLLYAAFLTILWVSVIAGVPISKRSVEMKELKFNDIHVNQDSILTNGQRIKRQVAENSTEGSVAVEKQPESVTDIAEPNVKPEDKSTGSLTSNAPEVLPAITEIDQSVPKTEGDPEITKSGSISDQALDLAPLTTTKESSSTTQPMSPAPTQNDKDLPHIGTTAPSSTQSEIDKKTTSGIKTVMPNSEYLATSESPKSKLEVTDFVNDPTSPAGVNLSSNTTTQSVTAMIPPQPDSSTEVPELGELKMTEKTSTVPIVDDKSNTSTTNVNLVPLQNEKPTTVTTLSPETETIGPEIESTETAVLGTSSPSSNETGVNLEAPPPPSENTTGEYTTVEVHNIEDNTHIVTATTISMEEDLAANVSMAATTTLPQSTVINPVALEALSNTTTDTEDSTTDTNVVGNETTTQSDLILPTNVSVLETGAVLDLTTLVNYLLNITMEATTNETIILNNDTTTEDEVVTNTTAAMPTMVVAGETNSTDDSTMSVILVNITDSNITTTTFPVLNTTESLSDNDTVVIVPIIPENETLVNATTTPTFLHNDTTDSKWANETTQQDSEFNVTNSYNITITSMDVTTTMPLNGTVSSVEQINVTTTTVVNTTAGVNSTTYNATLIFTDSVNTTTAITIKEATILSDNLTTVAAVPTARTTGAFNTTTVAPSTTRLPDTTTTTSEGTNTSAAVGQSQGLSASALTAIITGSIIGFWIILGPIICLVCKVRDKRKERYHMRLSSLSDPPADNGMLDAMIISELKKTSESSHDNGTTKEKEYNTVVKDKTETERLQPNVGEHEF